MNRKEREYLLMEIAIEVAWQLKESNIRSRTEDRHELVDMILAELSPDKAPKEDLDKWIKKELEDIGITRF